MEIPDRAKSEVRKIFGFVLRGSPQDFAAQMIDVPPDDLRGAAIEHITQLAESKSFMINGTPLDADDCYYVGTSILNEVDFLNPALERGDINIDTKTTIARHPKTIRTLIQLALKHNPDVYLGYLGLPSVFELSEDETHIVSRELLIPDYGGSCPFAGDNLDQKIDPLFLRAHQWNSDFLITHNLLRNK